MKRIIGIILIVIGLGLGIKGAQDISNSGGSVEIAGLELSAEDSGAKTQGMVFVGLGIILLVVGGSIVRKK
ncbi:MAG: hypothetical protein Sapg2KO_52750 [Saprospiraceae bacterium]